VVTGRLPLLLTAAAAQLALGACAGHTNVSDTGGRCNEQITLSLAPGYDRTDKVIKELSRGAGVRLDYLRSASLRQDSRVRFAELDVRRTTFGATR
jgi:hypothetical protein